MRERTNPSEGRDNWTNGWLAVTTITGAWFVTALIAEGTNNESEIDPWLLYLPLVITVFGLIVIFAPTPQRFQRTRRVEPVKAAPVSLAPPGEEPVAVVFTPNSAWVAFQAADELQPRHMMGMRARFHVTNRDSAPVRLVGARLVGTQDFDQDGTVRPRMLYPAAGPSNDFERTGNVASGAIEEVECEFAVRLSDDAPVISPWSYEGRVVLIDQLGREYESPTIKWER